MHLSIIRRRGTSGAGITRSRIDHAISGIGLGTIPPGAAIDPIVPFLGVAGVYARLVAHSTHQAISARPPEEPAIVTETSFDEVCMSRTVNLVGPTPALQSIAASTSHDVVPSGATEYNVVTSKCDDFIRAPTPTDDISAGCPP
jgi:hypothetical protein